MTKFTPSQVRGTEAQDVELTSRSSRRWLWLAVPALLLVVFFAASATLDWTRAERSVNAERLRFATVERGPFIRDTAVSGFVVAGNSPTLYTPAAGVVALRVRAGDAVEEGDVLATVESPELNNQSEQESAALLAMRTELSRLQISTRQRALAQRKGLDDARVALTAADREQRRAEEAFAKNAISRIDLEKARDELERARLEFNHAEEEQTLLADALGFEIESQKASVARQELRVKDLQRRVADLEIRSPVTGMVGNVVVDQRAVVAAHQPLLTVVDLTAYEVEANVPETYANSLALGMPAEVTYGREHYAGVVTSISPEVEQSQVAVRLRFEDRAPTGLRQNQRVSARLIFDERDDVVTVQRGPFFESGNGRIAYAVTTDGVAQRRPITTGAVGIDRIEIIAGLDVGDRVVISNTDAFRDAESVFIND